MASRTPASRTSSTASSTKSRPTRRAPAHIVQDPDRVLKRYLLWHEAEGHSRKTELNYRTVLRLFFNYLKSEHQIEDLNEVDVEHVRAWLVYLRNTPTDHNEPRSSKTIENYARHVLGFLHWCLAEEVLDHDPTERVRLRQGGEEAHPRLHR